MSNEVTQGVSNYLVPATGSPNAYVIKDTFTASPQSVNFQNIQLNGLAFRPSGVIIDNTKSASPLVVLIPEMSFNISCPAGASLNMPYPAPMNHTASITGAGDAEATVIFVDYPLQPYSSAQAAGSPAIPNPLPVSVPNPLPVSGPITDAEIRATALIVSGPLTDAEIRATPIQVEIPNNVSPQSVYINYTTAAGSIPAGSTSVYLKVITGSATIQGSPGITAGTEFTFFSQAGKTLGQITFDATGGGLLYSGVV